MPRWFTHRRRTDQVDQDWAGKAAEIASAQRARQAALTGQESFVAEVESLLFRLDPIGINFGENTDEYRAEAETITIRLPEAHDERDLARIVYEEFVRWFSASVAGGPERYVTAAHEIWNLRNSG